ncbi:NAD(P)-dependent oxidoreductase [Kaistia algarum]|nr:NAD(P)-dependent oxidoreductase [Kaistia algarum]
MLVTGASGQLGRQVIEALLEAKAGPIIATTRDPSKLADFAARGVDVRVGDFNDPSTLAAAFAGAGRLLLISTDELATPGRRLAQHRAAVAAAEAAGVQHVVYLSAPAPYPTAESSLIGDHYWTEQALAASSLGWSFLRDHLYTDLLLMSLPHAVQTGQLFSATGQAGRNFVTRADCARTAAAVLASDFGGRQILDVTGPAPLTFNDLATLAGEIAGKPVQHIAVPAEGLRQGLIGAGLPPFMADALVAFDVDASKGYHAITTSVVKDWTGRDPVSVRDFLEANRAALVTAA